LGHVSFGRGEGFGGGGGRKRKRCGEKRRGFERTKKGGFSFGGVEEGWEVRYVDEDCGVMFSGDGS